MAIKRRQLTIRVPARHFRRAAFLDNDAIGF